MKVPELKKHYIETVVPQLVANHGFKNRHEVPRIVKVVLNTGISAAADKTLIAETQKDLSAIAGQKAVLTKSRKAISNFKLRKGQIVGSSVTLRGANMWEFLTRLLAIAIPAIRDFRGVHNKLDGSGNYCLGIADYTIFPEISLESSKRTMGLDISIVTTAETDDDGRELLRLVGFPFRRTEPVTPKATAA